MDRPNVVLIMTDTQSKRMVGAYGEPAFRTPNLDRLAAAGVRFERAYTACPLCTPARGSIFSGMMPSNHGAWANEMSPQRHVPLMGEVVRALGCRAGYTGKWHLDGAGYHGAGNPDGGFEPDWWYDGKRYLDDIGGMNRLKQFIQNRQDAAKLREVGCTIEDIWGHRVADRAIDFLRQVNDDPFVLAVSFDEPHGPFVVPPEFADAVNPDALPERPNYNASLEGKPAGHREQAVQFPCPDWRTHARERLPHWNCNAYVDYEIGRVIDAVRELHGDDTYIIYTADHGDMMGSHGLRSKGAMMYEETTNIPLLIAGPGIEPGQESGALVSHLDLLPTILGWMGESTPAYAHGRDIGALLADPSAEVRETVTVQFNRFGLYHHGQYGLVPIRCTMDSRYKLVVNLWDTDELYDLREDPYEMTNRIDDPALAEHRDRLHDAMLDEMYAICDPFRGDQWRNRPWREGAVHTDYFHQPTLDPPEGLIHGRPPNW
ncbi:MAG: sulfatase-like hydrolase/transferase [Phycisphaerae bacterium]